MTSSGPPSSAIDPALRRATLEVARGVAPGPAVDGERLAVWLRRHRLIGHASTIDGWTDTQRAALLPLWRASAARSLAHAAILPQILHRLRKAGLRATPIKGVAFQRAMTGSPTGRDHRDLDVWVDDLGAAAQILLEDGWQGRIPDPLPSALTLRHPGGLSLDLHRRLFARRYALHRVDALLERQLRPDGELSVDGHAFLALLHAGKDGWSTLRHLVDIRRAARRADPHTLRELVASSRTRRLVDVGMALCDRLVGPTGWTPHEATDRWVEPLERTLWTPLREGPSLRGTLLYLTARESWSDRLRAVVGIPLQVSEGDRPGRVRILRRAIRLIRTYGPAPIRSTDYGS